MECGVAEPEGWVGSAVRYRPHVVRPGGFCDPLRLMIVVLVAATAVTVLNNSMITVVLAAVGRDLSATPSALGWTATGYLLPFAAGNALAGLLSDRVSLRRVFMLGLVVFAVGTVAAGTAPSVTWLIIARGVQGDGGPWSPPCQRWRSRGSSRLGVAARHSVSSRLAPARRRPRGQSWAVCWARLPGGVRCSGCPQHWSCPSSSAQRGPSAPPITLPPRRVPS